MLSGDFPMTFVKHPVSGAQLKGFPLHSTMAESHGFPVRISRHAAIERQIPDLKTFESTFASLDRLHSARLRSALGTGNTKVAVHHQLSLAPLKHSDGNVRILELSTTLIGSTHLSEEQLSKAKAWLKHLHGSMNNDVRFVVAQHNKEMSR